MFDASKNASELSQHSCSENDAVENASFLNHQRWFDFDALYFKY